jgi:UDP-N-acetylglucosamine acyltransferase
MSGNSSPSIHPTAIVSAGAELASSVVVGPYCIIGDLVQVGEGTAFGPSVVVEGPCRIGRNNRFIGQAAVGTAPQDLKYAGEPTLLEIGDDNVVREFVTLNRGTAGGGGVTRIGNNNLLMTCVHVAHDCHVADRVIMANAATLAGHVLVESDSTVGAFTGVHQFCRVGVHAFIGGYSVITRDALPFMKTVGIRNDAKSYGINTIGLERKGFDRLRLDALRAASRTLFRRNLRLDEAVERVRSEETLTEDVELLLRFVETSERGFIR